MSAIVAARINRVVRQVYFSRQHLILGIVVFSGTLESDRHLMLEPCKVHYRIICHTFTSHLELGRSENSLCLQNVLAEDLSV